MVNTLSSPPLKKRNEKVNIIALLLFCKQNNYIILQRELNSKKQFK